MTISGKADGFEIEDLRQLGCMADLKPRQTDEIVHEVDAAAERWDEFATEAEVPDTLSRRARAGFRTW